MTDSVVSVRNGPVVSIVIDRTERANSLTQELWDRLTEVAASVAADAGVHVVVVRSTTERVFCAGADVGEYREHAGDVEWGMASQRRVGGALDALRAIPVPTVAAIGGPCMGGGAGIAMACDLRVATASATFAITPAKLGLVFPFTDTARLVDLVGPAAAARILLTGETFDARRALRIGFVDEVVADGELGDAVERWTATLRACSPVSQRAMKRTIALAASGQRVDSPETLALVRDALAGPDAREGAAAFLERRPPVWD